MLDALVNHHLLDEPTRHRYRMHDLLRDYANQRARIDEDGRARGTAVRRMLDYYLYVANNAAQILVPHDDRLDVPVQHVPQSFPPVSSAAEAQEWFEQEYLNLLALAHHALDRKAYHHAARLPHALAQYLDRRGRWKEAVEAHHSALHAWYALGDTTGQAGALIDLATAHWGTEQLDLAQFYAETALTMYREHADEAGQADAHLHLGRVHWHARRPALADQHLRECATLRAKLKDQRGLGVATYHLGIVALEFGVPEDSLGPLEKALRIARNTRDSASELYCLNNLGEAYQRLGRYAEAERHYQEALTVARRIGNPHQLAIIAHNLGGVYAHTGDHAAALASFESALSTFRQIEDVRSEIDTLIGMSDACRELGREAVAYELMVRALALVELMEDPLMHDKVHYAFGEVHRQRAQYPQALQAYRSALAHARRAAAPAEQARALRRIGDVLAVTRGPGAARQQWRKALELYAELRLPEAEQVRDLIANTAPTQTGSKQLGPTQTGPKRAGTKEVRSDPDRAEPDGKAG
jgi:tetratricopeptide (TPR) repeat protein